MSDHALVRWLERSEGYPLDQVRADILSPATLAAMRLGHGRVHCVERQITLVVRNWTVVTALPLEIRGRKA